MASVITSASPPILAEVVAGRAPPVQPLTIDQLDCMIEHGILHDGAAVELIDGVLVKKDRSARGEDPMTHNAADAKCVARLLRLIPRVEALGYHVRSQLPIALSPIRAPEPDFAIIRGTPEDYQGHPGPGDVVAVIEVADSSLDYDRKTKRRLYAGGGIPTYCIANLVDDLVELYEQPDPQAEVYGIREERRRGQMIDIQLHSEATLSVRVDEIL